MSPVPLLTHVMFSVHTVKCLPYLLLWNVLYLAYSKCRWNECSLSMPKLLTNRGQQLISRSRSSCDILTNHTSFTSQITAINICMYFFENWNSIEFHYLICMYCTVVRLNIATYKLFHYGRHDSSSNNHSTAFRTGQLPRWSLTCFVLVVRSQQPI